MRALILAAGVSRRLYPVTYDKPKCMISVGRKMIIDYQLEALERLNIRDLTVVVGYYREILRDYLLHTYPQLNFQFVINHHFFETNTAYSVYLCRHLLREHPCILMNADVLYPRALLQRIVESPHPSVMAVVVKPCGREEVKVIEGAENRVVGIGKELIQENVLGEFIGVAKFDLAFTRRFADSLEKLIDAGGKADYFEAAIHPLLSEVKLYYEDVSDLPCIEIDFQEDLKVARELARGTWFT
jgi:choline kinase